MIDFYADWCAPCKAQSPVLAEVARILNGKLKVIKIDVDKNPAIAQRYQIRGVPTLALFRDGETLWKQSGLIDKSSLMSTILSHL